MKLCATVNLFINAENNPTVQFEPKQEYLEMSPLKQALMAHAAVQIGMKVVQQIIDENPEYCDEICKHIEASTLEQGTPRPN